MDFHAAKKQLPELKELLEKQQTALKRSRIGIGSNFSGRQKRNQESKKRRQKA